jgi:hypothetical protein
MKLSDWKNLWFYAMFTSSSTIWCCSDIKVVKATHPNKQTNQAIIVSNISSLSDSRPITKLSDQFSSNHNEFKGYVKNTTKYTSVVSQPETIQIDRFDIKAQALNQDKGNISILQKDNCSGSKMLTTISKPLTDAKISKPLTDAIVLQRGQDARTTNQHFINSGCSSFSVSNQELTSKQIEIAQNQEPSTPPTTPENIEKNPPPLESQPTDFPAPSPEEIEQKLNTLEDERSKRLERLLQQIQENRKKAEENEKKQQAQQFINNELGTIVAVEVPQPPQPPEQKQPPPIEKPVTNFKPVGYLLGRVGYFHTSNIFSSRDDAIDDGLIFSGLTLAAAPFKIGPKTYLNGSIDGNIIRYSDQSEFDYNQIRFNLGVYQQLTSRMYSEIGWNNQQLFYSKNSDRFNFSSGDKFLNENSFRLSVGRRDPLGAKLNLDSFYELRLSLTNPPEERNRIINYVWLSLNYSLQKSLRLGLDYQFNLSNFLERTREDQYHRLSANLKYSISDLSSINLQSGFTLGGSTDPNLDFDGWFFSVNYSWDLGQF